MQGEHHINVFVFLFSTPACVVCHTQKNRVPAVEECKAMTDTLKKLFKNQKKAFSGTSAKMDNKKLKQKKIGKMLTPF